MKIIKWIYHTTIHKFWIFCGLSKFALRLVYRGLVHDLSKYSICELKGYSQLLPRLKGTTYGSEEYKQLLKELKPTIEHHYRYNRHHPEFYKNGIKEMELIDVVEMFIDWQISVKKHADGDLNKSLDTNRIRFGMSEDLTQIMRNSIKQK